MLDAFRGGPSHKKPQRDHINRADRKAVRNWQYRLNRLIPCLEGVELIVLMQDEAFFMHDVIASHKYWVPGGRWISASYAGSRRKITVHGYLAKDDRYTAEYNFVNNRQI